MGGGFRKPDIPWNDGFKDPVFEIGCYLPHHILGKLGSLVIHGKENAADFELVVQAFLNPFDGLKEQ